MQFHPQRHLTTFGNVLSESAGLWELSASQNAKSFFSRKREKTFGTFNNTLKLESLISPKLNEKRYLSHVFLDISLQKMSYLVVRIISD